MLIPVFNYLMKDANEFSEGSFKNMLTLAHFSRKLFFNT